MFDEIIKKWGGHEVSAMQVYTDLFGLGEGLIQRQDEEPGEFKSNPLGYWKNDGEQRGHRRILFDDTFEETLKEMQEADFSIMYRSHTSAFSLITLLSFSSGAASAAGAERRIPWGGGSAAPTT